MSYDYDRNDVKDLLFGEGWEDDDHRIDNIQAALDVAYAERERAYARLDRIKKELEASPDVRETILKSLEEVLPAVRYGPSPPPSMFCIDGVRFVDVERLLAEIEDTSSVATRSALLADKGPITGIAAVGGFPVQMHDWALAPTIFGCIVSPTKLRRYLIQGLGLGGMMTHLNISSFSLESMGEKCLSTGHHWTFHSIPVTLLFVGFPPFVEMSFARDGGFHLSWVEDRINGNARSFLATTSLKHWKKYTGHRASNDFAKVQRNALQAAHEQLSGLFADYFTG